LNQNPERYGSWKPTIGPIAKDRSRWDIRSMSYQQFLDRQHKAINIIFGLFVALLSFTWIATAADWLFALGWGWDRQILWLAPPMMAFAALVRFCAFAIFKFVGSNF
jgi:hypothetical protein